MGSEDRLQAVLARQAAAAAEKRRKEAADTQMLSELMQRRETAKALWETQKQKLDGALDRINAAMAGNDVRIYAWHTKRDGFPVYLDQKSYGLTERDEPGSIQKLSLVVQDSGKISATMGTKYRSSAKSIELDVASATDDDWFNVFLDFVDLNTPTPAGEGTA